MTDVTSIAHRSEVVRTRRGYTLLGLGLLLPGSAQAIHGRQRLGRFALKVWLTLVGLGILVLAFTLIFPSAMVTVVGSGWVLRILAVLVFAVGAFWAALSLNTWWIARPRAMGAKKGAIFSVVALGLAVALAAGTLWAGSAAWAAGGALGHIFSGGGDTQVKHGRYNILLLGSDSGPDRWGLRPDSITVASVDAVTGRTVLIGLPRNLEYVPFPVTSPLNALYPDGYGCPTEECLLNAIYLLGVENADLYPGIADPGLQAMIDGVTGATGLTINYWAMINMEGFVKLIDALGGLTITINQRVALGTGSNAQYLEPGPNQHLNGEQTLWFARTRKGTSDYDRMHRQKCVMAAMLAQLNPTTVAMNFTQLASASGDLAQTSVPASQISTLTALALKAKDKPLTLVSFTPPLIDPAAPDFAFIHQTVADTITASEALDNPKPASTTATPTSAPASPTDTPTTSGNITEDLQQVCSVG